MNEEDSERDRATPWGGEEEEEGLFKANAEEEEEGLLTVYNE